MSSLPAAGRFTAFRQYCAEGARLVVNANDRELMCELVAEELTELAWHYNLSLELGNHIQCQREIDAAFDTIEDALDGKLMNGVPVVNDEAPIEIEIDLVELVERGLISKDFLEMALVGPPPFRRGQVEALAIEYGLSIQRATEVGLIGPFGSYHDDPVPQLPAGIKLDFYEDFDGDAARKPIIKGVLYKKERSSWIGPPGSGKSALLADLAIHAAEGSDWRGYRSKDRVGVVYFALERSHLVKRRLKAQATDPLPIAVAGGLIDLKDNRCVATIVDTVRVAEARFARSVGLVIIDTFSKGIAAGGGDEDKAKDQNAAAANLQQVQDQLTDIHIALIGHTGKDETREQGSARLVARGQWPG